MLCSHSEATKSIKMYKRDGSLEQLEIKKRITCTDENLVYIILCTKQNGACAKVHREDPEQGPLRQKDQGDALHPTI